jgi:hypothetical protein
MHAQQNGASYGGLNQAQTVERDLNLMDAMARLRDNPGQLAARPIGWVGMGVFIVASTDQVQSDTGTREELRFGQAVVFSDNQTRLEVEREATIPGQACFEEWETVTWDEAVRETVYGGSTYERGQY